MAHFLKHLLMLIQWQWRILPQQNLTPNHPNNHKRGHNLKVGYKNSTKTSESVQIIEPEQSKSSSDYKDIDSEIQDGQKKTKKLGYYEGDTEPLSIMEEGGEWAQSMLVGDEEEKEDEMEQGNEERQEEDMEQEQKQEDRDKVEEESDHQTKEKELPQNPQTKQTRTEAVEVEEMDIEDMDIEENNNGRKTKIKQYMTESTCTSKSGSKKEDLARIRPRPPCKSSSSEGPMLVAQSPPPRRARSDAGRPWDTQKLNRKAKVILQQYLHRWSSYEVLSLH